MDNSAKITRKCISESLNNLKVSPWISTKAWPLVLNNPNPQANILHYLRDQLQVTCTVVSL